jgi:hypothetical protein
VATPEPHLASLPGPRRRRESDVTLSVFLVLLLATTVMAWPLREAGADRLHAALRGLTLLAGVVAVAPARPFALAAALAAVAVGYGELVHEGFQVLELGARLAFYVVVCAALLGRVFRPGHVTVHRLLGGVGVYVLLAVAWGTAYQLATVLRPDAIQGRAGPATLDEAMWLSFITITTTGYGDVLPSSPLARSLAALEALAGVLFPAILISRLVSLLRTPPQAGRPDAEA